MNKENRLKKPKIEQKIEQKIEPKIEQKIEPKIEQKIEQKIEPKIEVNIDEKTESTIDKIADPEEDDSEEEEEESSSESEPEDEEKQKPRLETSKERIERNERKMGKEKKKRLEKLRLNRKKEKEEEKIRLKKEQKRKLYTKEKKKRRKSRKEEEENQVKSMQVEDKAKSIEEVCVPRLEVPSNYKQVDGYILKDEEGEKLIRKLGETDDELRRRMRDSVKKPVKEVMAVSQNDEDWVEVNLGVTYVSEDNVHNLFAAVSAQQSKLGTVMHRGGGGYMINEDGVKFELIQKGKQLRFKARIYDDDNNFEEVVFVHDSGCGVNLINKKNTMRWKNKGDGRMYIGGYNGGENIVFGGNDLRVKMRPMKTTEPKAVKGRKYAELTMSMVIEEI